MIACLRSLREARRGVAIIEFAMTFPVLLLLFLAGYQVSDAVACKRKVGITNRTIVDLGSQPKLTTAAEVDDVLSVSTQVMIPYPASRAYVRLSQVYTDTGGQTKIVWSRARNGLARAQGSTITLPGTLKVNDTYLLLSEITYSYKPGVAYGIVQAQQLSDSLYMSPRNSASVPCNDC